MPGWKSDSQNSSRNGPSPHTFAAKLGIGVIVGQATGLNERDDRLDEKPPRASLAIANRQPGLGGQDSPVVVHAEEQRRIGYRRALDRLIKDSGRARFCQEA